MITAIFKIYTGQFIAIIISSALCCTANAQKLPPVQLNNWRAPANVKIDGNASEWHNIFQAYNKHTGIFYTIANNDDCLYLLVQATDPDIIAKLIGGGLTFTIYTSGDKKDKNPVAVSFPAFDKSYAMFQSISMKNKPVPTNDIVRNRLAIDSFQNDINQQLARKAKMIGVTGVKGIDSLISIYNSEGIKAAVQFDVQSNYTYELAFPLKYLSAGLSKPIKLAYNIKLNGASVNGTTVMPGGSGRFITVFPLNGHTYVMVNNPQFVAIAYPSDFWGEYTLVK